MNWILKVIGAVACATCLMIGLTAGINLNPASTVTYVWDWGAAGGWISGLGATAAAVVAIVQSQKNAANERIRARLIDVVAAETWSLRLLSEGLIPVTVLGAEIVLGENRYQLPLATGHRAPLKLPARLERGDVLEMFGVEGAAFKRLGVELGEPIRHALNRKDLQPAVNFRVDESFFTALENHKTEKAIILIRLAHQDLTHELSPFLIEQLIGGYANDLRLETSNRTAHERASLLREFAPLFNQEHQD